MIFKFGENIVLNSGFNGSDKGKPRLFSNNFLVKFYYYIYEF